MQDRPLTEEDEIEGARQLPGHGGESFEPEFDLEEEPDFAAHLAPHDHSSTRHLEGGQAEDVVVHGEAIGSHHTDVGLEAAGSNRIDERQRTKPPQKNGLFIRYLAYALGGVTLVIGVLFGLNSLVDRGRGDDLTVAASSVTREMEGEAAGGGGVSDPIPPQPMRVPEQNAELTERERGPVAPVEQVITKESAAEDNHLVTELEQSKTREAEALSRLNASMVVVAQLKEKVAALEAASSAAANQKPAAPQQSAVQERLATKSDGAKPAPIPQSAKPAAPKVQAVVAKKHRAQAPTPTKRLLRDPRPGQTSFVQAAAVTPTIPTSTGTSAGMGQITVSSVMNGRVVITDQSTGKTEVKGVGSVIEGRGSIVSITPNGCVMFSSAQRIGRCE
ncbi:hypothetical protein [Aeromonas caviae]|uniref:Type IV pilus biogenesis protein PilP n=1 Tax=Aeromonas caviae TaxID=648 RepID=A0AAJ6CQ41_AERCA|nr:hypothetical protein [Aeromonas caviae]WFG00252.1 hypothetical protein P5S46_21050 [Aeromonas caviae]